MTMAHIVLFALGVAYMIQGYGWFGLVIMLVALFA
jgi:hypothetical protein